MKPLTFDNIKPLSSQIPSEIFLNDSRHVSISFHDSSFYQNFLKLYSLISELLTQGNKITVGVLRYRRTFCADIVIHTVKLDLCKTMYAAVCSPL